MKVIHPVLRSLPGPIGLASRSPRRAEVLKEAGIPFRIIPTGHTDETGVAGTPEEVVCDLARRKAMAAGSAGETRILLTADTLVVADGQILGKPSSTDEARGMLERLSGKVSLVITGLCVVDRENGRTRVEAETTRVYFRTIDPGEIDGYLSTDEPYDKAGGYGIQGMAGLFVERIEGCYFNVVGLPLHRLGNMLREILVPDSKGSE